MAETLPVRKIFVDSRFKTAKSNSNSDFEYEIPQSVSLPDATICYLDNIVIPNSWKTIDSNNNRLYVRVSAAGPPGQAPANNDAIVGLTANNYSTTTLRVEIEAQLRQVYGNSISVTYDQVLLRYKISSSDANKTIRLFTDSELISGVTFGQTYSASDLRSANEVLTIFEPQQANPYFTGIVNLARYRNLYISCTTLSDYSTISPSGNYNIVKKVPVTAGYGEMIYCNLQAAHDHFDVSRMMIKTLDFKITDSYGRVVDLQGMPVSFSMIFQLRNAD